MTEVWFRNPLTYIKECAELLVPNIAWDRGLLHKKRVDAQRHLEAHYPTAVDYRILLIGDQGAAELRHGFGITNPYAVYPVWEYGVGSMMELREMLDSPWGEDERACKDPRLVPDERPVLGQEHRVVIIRYPESRSPLGKRFLIELADIQEEYPEAIIHIHGGYSFRVAFGLGFRSADVGIVEASSKGKVYLPNGKEIVYEKVAASRAWGNVAGGGAYDLTIARERTLFCIKSANWAGKYFNQISKFPAMTDPAVIQAQVDAAMEGIAFTPVATTSHFTKSMPVLLGDKIACDTCSLSPSCKYFREGGICAIKGTEMEKLSAHFKTRDSERIVAGILASLQMQADRAQVGVAEEQFDGELNPEVTKILHDVMTTGIKVAKLVDPVLASAGATKIGVFINGNPAPVNGLVGQAMQELQAQGVALEDITDEMVGTHIAKANRPKAIDVTAS